MTILFKKKIQYFFNWICPNKRTYHQFSFLNDNILIDLIENSVVGLYQTTPSGSVIFANTAIVKMLNFDSLKDLLSRDLSKGSYVDENKRESFKKLLEQNGEVKNFQSEWYTKDGKIIYVNEGAYAVKNDLGEIIRYDGYVEDITALVTVQKELEKAKMKAEELSQLKSAFLSNISHEIRTPMNSILGFSELLSINGLTNEKQSKYIKLIQENGSRMLQTITDIITMSQISTGYNDVYLSEISVAKLLKEVYELYKSASNNKKVDLICVNDFSNENTSIYSDEIKIYEVLSILIDNALKYTHEGKVEFGYISDKNEFFVKDTGIGIPLNEQKDIFECFYRVDIRGDKFYDGSGAGLTIAKAYVEMLEGKISVKSNLGEGSVFSFSLPRKK